MSIIKHVDFEVPGFGEFDSPVVAVSSYAQAVLALSPLAYWRLNEQDGTTLFDQMSAHPLTLTGGYTLGQAGALAVHQDDAIRFDSGTASSSGPVLPTAASAAFSILFWVRTAGAISTWRSIAQQYRINATGHTRLIFRFNGLLRYQSFGEALVDTVSAVSTDWTMVALTRDAEGGLSWFINGELDRQSTGHTSPIADTDFKLAAYRAGQHDLFLDEFAVFDQALSAAQIRSLYDLGSGYFFESTSQ